MRSSNLFGKTLRQAPSDTENISHKLLVRAGFIQQIASGIFSAMPLGNRSLSKIKNIIREEMNGAGAQEVNMPVVQPIDIWEESGRAENFSASNPDTKVAGILTSAHANKIVAASASFNPLSVR